MTERSGQTIFRDAHLYGRLISGWRGHVIVLVGLGVIGVALYGQVFDRRFVLDSRARIEWSSDIRLTELSPAAMSRAAFGNNTAQNRPVGNLSFALNYYVHRYDPFGYHLVNLAVHVLAGFLLFLVLRQTLKLSPAGCRPAQQFPVALFGALLWFVHPVNTQSVSYIIQRLNSMAAMFFMMALWLYIQGRLHQPASKRWLWLFGSALAWLLALGCKQNTATLPIMVYLYEWYFFQDLSRDWFRRSLKWIGGIVAVLALVALVFIGGDPADTVLKQADYGAGKFTIGQRVLTQSRVVMHYIGLFFLPLPSRLNLDYDFPLSYSLFNPPTTVLSVIAIVVLIGAGLAAARRHRMVSFAVLWFFGNLVIESSVIPLAIIFEHRTYLPYMMLAPLVSWTVYRLSSKPKFSLITLAVVTTLFAAWTWQRNTVWADPVRLWSDTVAKSPLKGRPHLNLGVALGAQGDKDGAERSYLRAIELDPLLYAAYNNLALIRAQNDDPESAEMLYRKALQLHPEFVQAINNYAALLISQGKPADAIPLLEHANRLDPGFRPARLNLGNAWQKLKKPEKAEATYRVLLEMDPESTKVETELARVLIEQGRYDEAIVHLEQVIEDTPDYLLANELLLDVLLKKGDTQKLEPQLERLLAIDPDNIEAHTNMGGILIGRGDIDGAIDHLQQVLDQDPAHAEALNNMGIALASKGRYSDAGDAFLAAILSRPEFADAWDNLFHLGRVAGPRWDMESALRRHAEDHPGNPESHVLLGEFFLRQGDAGRAGAAFASALDLDPDNARATERLSGLKGGPAN